MYGKFSPFLALAIALMLVANRSDEAQPTEITAEATAMPPVLSPIAWPTEVKIAQTPTPDSSSRSVSEIAESVENGLVYIETPTGSGSGFIVTDDGLTVTNAHIVGQESFVTVRLVDGQSYTGQVLGRDKTKDLAVIKINSRLPFQPMKLGNVKRVDQGDDVVVLGFPLSDSLGQGYEVTKGIVSFRGIYPDGVERIQTDAAVNPGNSGGPLLNMSGQVIGVNTPGIKRSPGGTSIDGIGLAVSVAEVRKGFDSLASGGDGGSRRITTPTVLSPVTWPAEAKVAQTPTSRSVSEIVESAENGLAYIETSTGSGSGFIVTDDGLIVTNAHVVGQESFVTVRLVNDQSYTGRVLGRDEITDLAVINIDSRLPFQPMKLGNANRVDLGDEVIALGFPLGDELGQNYKVTRGIVSSRETDQDGVEVIQTDAAINPGNSGGPLLNMSGQVIGVNTSTVEKYGDRIIDGISFAVSVGEVRKRFDSLASGGDLRPAVDPPGSSACLTPLTPEQAEAIGLGKRGGCWRKR